MITFIAPTFQEINEPYMFISSLLLQNDPRWKAIIYSNGNNAHCKAIVDLFNDPRITYKESTENTGFWGCYNRIEALNNLVDTEYVCQTSIQDYFTPNAVRDILNRNSYDFIYWNSIHNHFDWQILNAEMKPDRIDWGNFAIKTNIAKLVGINQPEYSGADAVFVDDVLPHLKNIIKIDKILTIHN